MTTLLSEPVRPRLQRRAPQVESAEIEGETRAGAALRAEIVRIAVAEWERWGRGGIRETDPRITARLQEYYAVGVGRQISAGNLRSSAWQAEHPWSAVFISYVMRSAGAGGVFAYSARHTDYVCAAKRAREGGAASPQTAFWAYRIGEARPAVGDLVCKDRKTRGGCAETTYESVCGRGASHCDVVVEVDAARNRMYVIGGNVDHSVGRKTVRLTSTGHLPERGGDGCRWIAVLKPPPAGAAPATPATGTGTGTMGSLPGPLQAAVRQGTITLQAALAILSGSRDEGALTNLVFYARHPELPVGYRIQPQERALVQSWLEIRNRVVRPLLRALPPVQAAGPAAASAGASPPPAAAGVPPLGGPREPPGYRVVHRTIRGRRVKRGLARYGGGRLDRMLRALRAQGRVVVTNEEIDLFQRIANVETGGQVQALNTWDSAVVSIGFLQLTLQHGKLQEWIGRAPAAFRRYGIALDPGRSYTWNGRRQTAIAGAATREELRWNGWAERFYQAGLDPEIVAAQVQLAREWMQRHLQGLQRVLRARGAPTDFPLFMQHYRRSPAVRGLFQEAYNNLPVAAQNGTLAALHAARREGGVSTPRFLALLQAGIRQAYRARNDSGESVIRKTLHGAHP